MDLPGSLGWGFLGEKSVHFYKDPLNFVDDQIKANNSKVFQVRFLNKPTVFVCSSQGIKDVLEGTSIYMIFSHFLYKLLAQALI